MNFNRKMTRFFTLCTLLVIFVQGCSTSTPEPTVTSMPSPSPLPTNTMPPTVEPSPTFTPPPVPNLPTETVTPLPISTNDPNAVVAVETPTETPKSASSGTSKCYGMTGRIEVKAVVAEAAGLVDPFSIGEIPFEVTTQYAPYRVAGRSKMIYKDKTELDWGSYKGDINVLGAITGQCMTGENDGELHLNISLNGKRFVVVRSKGFNKQITWDGSPSLPLIFGWFEGYTMSGDEWLFVLHKGVGEE